MRILKWWDTLLSSNQNLFRVANEKTTSPMLSLADQVLYSVSCIIYLCQEGLTISICRRSRVCAEGKARWEGEASGKKRCSRVWPRFQSLIETLDQGPSGL